MSGLVPMTFRRFTPGAYDEATGTSGPSAETSISGSGIVKSGDPVQYAAQELILETTPLFVFAPDPSLYPLKAYTPEFVLPNDTIEFNGYTYTVKKILKVVGPDGTVVLADIAASR